MPDGPRERGGPSRDQRDVDQGAWDQLNHDAALLAKHLPRLHNASHPRLRGCQWLEFAGAFDSAQSGGQDGKEGKTVPNYRLLER